MSILHLERLTGQENSMCKGPEGGKGLGVLKEVESIVTSYWKIKNLGMLKKKHVRYKCNHLGKVLGSSYYS